jgi:Family of unknown function (DUF5906)/Domain of unknown function (DUF3854)
MDEVEWGWGPAQAGTPIDWFQGRMRASGLTQEVVSKCGIKLAKEADHFVIPYYTVDGIETTHQRQRNRDIVQTNEPGVSGGNFKGKYTQKKGSKNSIYFAPIVNQRIPYNNPAAPLIICEGELKAVACQMAVMGSGIPALIIGFPGTRMCANTREQLLNIPCLVGDARREVFIAMDWNGRGQSRERSAEIEHELKRLFQGLGAQVYVLRWPLGELTGEQKLDDWLVAGGDISLALEHTRKEAQQVDTELSMFWERLNATYAIMHGNYIPLSNMAQKYNISQLNTMAADIRMQVTAKTFLKANQIWDLQPPTSRNEVDGYIFKPYPLGHDTERYVWEDGVRKLNTAPPSPWDTSPFGYDGEPDVAPFQSLLHRLCQENWEWMAKFLAHCAQRPDERGPHIVIFKDRGETGKSRLFETLDLVFGRYSGPIGDSLTSNFNAALEHLVIAWWSDPVIHGGFDRDLESALKNFSGDSKISINHKGGAKYVVKNYGRLLIATNKDWIVPVSSEERRYTVFGGSETMSDQWAAEYMSWLNTGGVEQIRRYLTGMSLEGFNIHERGPRTEQRMEMERLSAAPIARFVFEECTSKDVWSIDEIRQMYTDQTGKKMANNAIGMALKKSGCFMRPLRDGSKIIKLWALRNFAQWEGDTTDGWLKEYKSTGTQPKEVKF